MRPGRRFSVPGASLPPPVVLQSLRLSFSVLTPGSKSFPPRRDARNANNQPSATAWAGLGGDGGEPRGRAGCTREPGPEVTQRSRGHQRQPLALAAIPRVPRPPLSLQRPERPAVPSRVKFPAAGWEPRIRRLQWAPRTPRPAPGTPQSSCPPLPLPPALAGRCRARGPPAAALTDVCPAGGGQGPKLDPPCSAPLSPRYLDGAPRSLSHSLFRAAESLRRSRARSALDWRLQTTPRASRPAQSRARRRPEQRTGGGADSPRPPQLSLRPPDPCRWRERQTNSECRFTSFCLWAYPAGDKGEADSPRTLFRQVSLLHCGWMPRFTNQRSDRDPVPEPRWSLRGTWIFHLLFKSVGEPKPRRHLWR